MATFCLPPADAERFKKAIISGDIDPVKLAEMTSVDRRNFFASRFGDAVAGEMNRALEQKLLLKNQQAGMVTWAKKMMGGEKEKVHREDVINKVNAVSQLLTPESEDRFMEEVVSHKLGTRVTYEEAQQIAELAQKVEKAKEVMEAGGDRLPYGRAVVELRNFMGELALQTSTLRLSDFRRDPMRATLQAGQMVADNAKAINASMDNSALLRQGLKVLLTHPKIWKANAKKSFVDLVHAFGGSQVMNEVNAEIISRPNYPLMIRGGLDVGVNEEMFPTGLPEKIPGLGRIYRASEHAFAAFQRRSRADVFDKYVEIAKAGGVKLDGEELQSIAKMVNSLTGRGHLGRLERSAGVLNVAFFSPRMVKSQIDTLLLQPAGYKVTPFVRKEARKNLLKIIMGIAAVMAIIKFLLPDDDAVELDPRSSDFGKVKVGNTRFDITGGMGSVVVLASRLLSGQTKSSTSGEVRDLDSSQFGQRDRLDVVVNYFENKLSPAAAVVRDIMRGRTFEGEDPTVLNEAANLFVPLPVKTYVEVSNDPDSANTLLAMIAESLGVSVSDYSSAKK